MLPKLKSLAVFAKVAETGSFSAAANVLGISAPVVSQHISQLEKELDTALIYRSTRSLTLTEAGQRLSMHAHNMLDAAETGLEELETVMNSPRGKLSIAVPSFLASPKFTAIFAAFMDKYPDIDLEISYSIDHHNLNESGYDLAIQAGDLSDSNFMVRKLTEGYGCLFASPELIERHGAIKVPQDMFDLEYPFICEIGWSDMVLHKADGSGEIFKGQVENSRFWCDNGEAKKQMALLGRGLTWLPEMYVEQELLAGKLVRVLPDWTSELISVYAVWPRNAGSRSLTRLFLTFMSEILMAKVKPNDKAA
ncbi:MAG: LysR family transcriptional regulator [Amylibacter sp.]